jgi:endoglucanase
MAYNRPLFLLGRRLSAFVFFALSSLAAYGMMAAPATVYAATGTVEAWWPAQNAAVTGVQPFKAILKDRALSDYQMYWQVDGGGLNAMNDSQTDYPHKEAMVDVTGWTWNSNATYSVAFIAKDASGAEIARTAVAIRNASQTAAATVSPTPAPTPTPTTNVTSTVTGTLSGQTTQTSQTTQTLSNATAPTAIKVETATLAIQVSSPLPSARLSGMQTVKAAIPNKDLSTYKMYWSVDSGGQTLMYDSTVGGAHKENQIDMTNWTWKGSKAYVLNFIAKDATGRTIAQTNVPVYVNISAPTTTTATVTTTTSTSASKLYVDPNNPATAQANAWRSTRPTDAAIMDKIGAQATGIWLGGWNADVQGDVNRAVTAAKAQNATATFVAYNIPGRDCGQYSAGGLSGKDAYVAWIQKVAAGIGSGNAIVILEPDALALSDCLSDVAKADRYATISAAVDVLAANPGTKVYLDAGHSGWIGAADMASRLSKAGIAKAAGFALNTSNFVATADNVAYGTDVSKAVGGKHFVVDTSRNGSGSNGEWCNPTGRSLGQAPTLSTGNPLVDAFLWAKRPGESDGNCNGGPSAGTWWPDYALDLAKRAGY